MVLGGDDAAVSARQVGHCTDQYIGEGTEDEGNMISDFGIKVLLAGWLVLPAIGFGVGLLVGWLVWY